MVAYHFDSDFSFGSAYPHTLDPFSTSVEDFSGVLRGGSPTVSQALVLDSEKGELVKAPVSRGKKGMSVAKALAALKSHSEAERRRRERINSHLTTLRGLVPCTEKMDKATLLAKVINQVKELKKTAIEACKGLLIPVDDDEVKVEPHEDALGDRALCFTASLCCDYRPDLLSDIRQAIDALQLKIVNAEVSTLIDRLKIELVFAHDRNNNAANDDDDEMKQNLQNSIHQALSSILEKGSVSPMYSPRITLPNKRKRAAFSDSSSFSS